jgi:hypothetical protein
MYEWVWSIGGMILTGGTEVLGEKHYTGLVVDVWMSMEHWWNDTDRGNWSTGRKTLYRVGGRCMNEYWALVEWYWQGKTEVLGEEHYTGLVVDVWISVVHWWNDNDRGNWSTGRKLRPTATLSTREPTSIIEVRIWVCALRRWRTAAWIMPWPTSYITHFSLYAVHSKRNEVHPVLFCMLLYSPVCYGPIGPFSSRIIHIF